MDHDTVEIEQEPLAILRSITFSILSEADAVSIQDLLNDFQLFSLLHNVGVFELLQSIFMRNNVSFRVVKLGESISNLEQFLFSYQGLCENPVLVREILGFPC